MSPRAVLRHETWTLEPDREPDSEPTTYAMQCVVDGETSPPSEDFATPQNWVLEHCGRHPSHHTFREIITRPWRRGGTSDAAGDGLAGPLRGTLLIIVIAGSCGFVISVAVSDTTP